MKRNKIVAAFLIVTLILSATLPNVFAASSYEKEADAKAAAEEALKKDKVNNDFKSIMGADGKWTYELFINPEKPTPSEEPEVVEENENKVYKTKEEAEVAAKAALEKDELNKGYRLMGGEGAWYYELTLDPTPSEKPEVEPEVTPEKEDTNNGYATKEEAETAAEKAIKKDGINKSYEVKLGADGKYYYVLSLEEKTAEVTPENNETEIVEGNENDGYVTEAEAKAAAEEALKNDSINKSYNVVMGADGRYYYVLSPVEKSEKADAENNETEIVEGNENDGYATEAEAKAAAEKALENDKINKSYKVAMSANGRYYYVLSPIEKENVAEAKENEEKAVEKTNYTLLAQPDFVWVRNGKNEKMFFKSNAPFDKFVGVKVDGKFIDAENYIAKAGSTEITLKEEYLKTLEDGKHTLTIASLDGEVNANFEITTAKAQVANTPATGSAIMLQAITFVISLLGLGTTVKLKK